MKTISEQISNAFKAAIAAAFSPTLDGIDIDPLVSPSANEKFGDYQSNAAMGLAKTLAEKAGEKTNRAPSPSRLLRS